MDSKWTHARFYSLFVLTNSVTKRTEKNTHWERERAREQCEESQNRMKGRPSLSLLLLFFYLCKIANWSSDVRVGVGGCADASRLNEKSIRIVCNRKQMLEIRWTGNDSHTHPFIHSLIHSPAHTHRSPILVVCLFVCFTACVRPSRSNAKTSKHSWIKMIAERGSLRVALFSVIVFFFFSRLVYRMNSSWDHLQSTIRQWYVVEVMVAMAAVLSTFNFYSQSALFAETFVCACSVFVLFLFFSLSLALFVIVFDINCLASWFSCIVWISYRCRSLLCFSFTSFS